MTKKEILTQVKEDYEAKLAITENDDAAADEISCIIEYCEKELTALEKDKARNAKRRAEKAAENAPLFETLEAMLSDKGITASEAATQIGVSVQKASSLLRALADEGKANVEDVKIPKKGSCKAYTKAIAE